MVATSQDTTRMPRQLRLFTGCIALIIAFALGVIFAFATRLDPRLVAAAFGAATLGAIYCLLMAIYLQLRQRNVAAK